MAIVLSIVAVSIGFLVLSSTIEAKEILIPHSRGWDLNFLDLSDVRLSGNAREIARPVIENKSTYIKNFYVSFEKTGDSATYVLTVKNNGKFDARISSISFTKPVCHGSGKNSINDSKLVCDNIEFFVKDSSGRNIKTGDILKRKDKENLEVTIRYTGKMPVETVEVENLSMTIIYVQE